MAFGTIMLNTDAHNEHVQNKMTEKQFIENIHHTSGGESVPTDFLEDLYERITTSEIKFSRNEMSFPDAIKMGHVFLHSKGSKWHNRWLVLCNNQLLFFKKPFVSVFFSFLCYVYSLILICFDRQKRQFLVFPCLIVPLVPLNKKIVNNFVLGFICPVIIKMIKRCLYLTGI